jgi:hypothetical protein
MKPLSNIVIGLGLCLPKDGTITVTEGYGPWIWQECLASYSAIRLVNYFNEWTERPRHLSLKQTVSTYSVNPHSYGKLWTLLSLTTKIVEAAHPAF